MPCPRCRSLQRGRALRCWKCGLDLTVPYVPEAAGTGAAATAAATPSGEGGAAEALGPASRGWLSRTFDPRITREELERAARGYDRLPWIESYRKPAGLGVLPLALFMVLAQAVLARMWVPFRTDNPAVNAPMDQIEFLIQLLQWAPVGFVALALFVYRGNPWAILIAAAAWFLAIGGVFFIRGHQDPPILPAYAPLLFSGFLG